MDILRIAQEMSCDPWAPHLKKALALVQGQRIAPVPGGRGYQVQGDHGTYLTTTDRCTCDAAKWRPRAWCSHRTAVELLQRIGRDMSDEISPVFPTPIPVTNNVRIALWHVQRKIAAMGVAKLRKNQEQGFMFRGIEDIQNAIAPLFGEEGILLMPEVVELTQEERKTSQGKPLYNTKVCVVYTFVHAESGTEVKSRLYGEGANSGDKGTSIAMTSAFKTLLNQVFCIPFEAMDGDQHSPEIDEKEVGREGRVTPIMTGKGNDPAALKSEITRVLKDRGKSEVDIERYWEYMEKKYQADLPRRLPGILREMREASARDKKEAVHG